MRNHRAAIIAAALLWAPPVWAFIKWSIDWVGRFETIPSLLKRTIEMLDYVLSFPPPLANILLVLAGLGLIWWDLKGRPLAWHPLGAPSENPNLPVAKPLSLSDLQQGKWELMLPPRK